jgi:hypothetical protein
VSFILKSMVPEPVVGVVTLSEMRQEESILFARRVCALVLFGLSCLWLFGVGEMLYLNSFSVLHVSDPVLVAAIALIPALFIIFNFMLPAASTRSHVIYERDSETGKLRIL